jgi:hypothetical protein
MFGPLDWDARHRAGFLGDEEFKYGPALTTGRGQGRGPTGSSVHVATCDQGGRKRGPHPHLPPAPSFGGGGLQYGGMGRWEGFSIQL